MPVTASGVISLRLEDLRRLLCDCPSWRSWVGASNAAGAVRHTHLVDIPHAGNPQGYAVEELQELRPLARIDEYEETVGVFGGFVMERQALGFFVPSGKLLLSFEDEVPAEDADDPAAAKLKFMNNIGAVLLDLADLGGGESDYLSIHRIEKVGRFERPNAESVPTQGDFLRGNYVIRHGL